MHSQLSPSFQVHSSVLTPDTINLPPAPIHKSTIQQKWQSGGKLDRGYTAFEFVMSENMLHTYLSGVPLHLTVFERDEFQKDVILGKGNMFLKDVLAGTIKEFQVTKKNEKKDIKARGCKKALDILDNNGNVVLEVLVAVVLEDLGVVVDPQFVEDLDNVKYGLNEVIRENRDAVIEENLPYGDILNDQMLDTTDLNVHDGKLDFSFAEEKSLVMKPDQDNNKPTPIENVIEKPVREEPTTNPEPQQQENIKQITIPQWIGLDKNTPNLASQIQQVFSVLSQTFKDLEKNRTITFAHKYESLTMLEDKIRTLCQSLQQREDVLKSTQEEMDRTIKNTEFEKQKSINEFRDASRRLQEDFEHRLTLETRKVNECEERRRKLLFEYEELQKRYWNYVLD
jgi:hypothetical protein